MTKNYENELAYELEMMAQMGDALSGGCMCDSAYIGNGSYLIGEKVRECEGCRRPRLRVRFLDSDEFHVLAVQPATGLYARAATIGYYS